MKQFFGAAALLLCFTVLALGFYCVRFSPIEASEPFSASISEEDERIRLEIKVSNGLILTLREAVAMTADALGALPLFVRDAGRIFFEEALGVAQIFREAQIRDGAYEI